MIIPPNQSELKTQTSKSGSPISMIFRIFDLVFFGLKKNSRVRFIILGAFIKSHIHPDSQIHTSIFFL